MPVGFPELILGAELLAFAGSYAQVHGGDPGAAGTANPITGVTARKSAALGAPAASGTVMRSENETTVAWDAADVGGDGTATHVSFWDADTAGVFRGSGALAAPVAITTGVGFVFAPGALAVEKGPLATDPA